MSLVWDESCSFRPALLQGGEPFWGRTEASVPWAEVFLYGWARSQGLLSRHRTRSCGTGWKGAVTPEPWVGDWVQMRPVCLSQSVPSL